MVDYDNYNANQHNIKENIDNIRRRIKNAAARAGREAKEIKILAVTKNVSIDKIEEAIGIGIKDFGENRVQELQSKVNSINTLNKKVNWHMIGHLQRNKVKYIADYINIIHSVDSIRLVKEINRRAQGIDRIIEILLQVNFAEEESKFGIEKDKVINFAKEVNKYKNVRVKGLMAIAPYYKNPEEARFVFRGVKKIFIDISRENIDNIDMEYLSMGMSNDFEVAIEEGANIVRIGSGIFGKR